jgi:hypothetical protein
MLKKSDEQTASTANTFAITAFGVLQLFFPLGVGSKMTV